MDEMSGADPIVGHKTFHEPGGTRHEPLRASEAEAMIASAEAARDKREATMPTEAAAISQMFQAYQRLRELGWREAIYCPKDGTEFSVIEPGSTGIHRCTYSGDWPNGSWWIHDGDTWPARPCLWRPRKNDDPTVDHGLCCASLVDAPREGSEPKAETEGLGAEPAEPGHEVTRPEGICKALTKA
jgi:hypothetical protein